MESQQTVKKITKNLMLSVIAQGVSLAVSFILGFIVPKFIDEFQYAHWQTFVLYVGYAGVLQFGLLDGLVLRYSQYDYEELDKQKFRSQFQFLLALSSVFCIVGILLSSIFIGGITRDIIILVSIGIITKNLFGYASYNFQITNRIPKYALLIILQRAVYALVVVVLLACKVNDFKWYCIAELSGDAVGCVFGFVYSKGLYFGKGLTGKSLFREVGLNVSAGIFLMLANFSSMFLIGGAKMIIQWRWDELVFGKVAFSFSLTNLFLTFITAMSVVLFPSLKRMKQEELPSLYAKIRGVLSPLLFVVMLVYFPLCLVLRVWLPNYSVSLLYLGVLLPIIIFTSKVSLLTNNYLKAYRKEKVMLIINVIAVSIGFGLALLCGYALNNLDLLLYSVVFAVVLRSIASEIVVAKIIGRKEWLDYLIEIAMTVVFILSARYLKLWIGCLVYFGALALYLVWNYKKWAPMLKGITNKLFKK